MYYDDDDGYDDPRARTWKVIAATGLVLIVGILVYWQLRPDSGSSGSASASASSTTTTLREFDSSTTTAGALDNTTPSTSAATPVTTDGQLLPATVTSVPSTTSEPSVTTVPPVTTVPTVETTSPTADTASPTTAPPSVATPPDATSPGYPTSPDGTPLPLVVIFDTQTVTIAGQVPSQAAKDRLSALALANSQFPDVEVVDNMVINPAVPISVGVRVIELNSARFPENGAAILPDHALELDRVVRIMQALPNISVVVIGHADQRGDDVTNFAISDERARAVVNYLLYLGVSPMRLSSRAAGESDLLSIGDDNAALALNRRTEFIFSGLLIE